MAARDRLRLRRRADHGRLAVRPARAPDRARRRRRREQAPPVRDHRRARGCFLVSILFATWVLDKLGLPKDLLRNISIGLLFLLAATLIVPQVGVLIERPLSRLSRRPSGDLGGGFLLGCALGFVFVPCGGPGDRIRHELGGVERLRVQDDRRRGRLHGRRLTRPARDRPRRPDRQHERCAPGSTVSASPSAWSSRRQPSRSIFNLDTKLQTWLAGLHAIPPGAHRGERLRQGRVQARQERRPSGSRRAHARSGRRAPRLRAGARLRRDRRAG